MALSIGLLQTIGLVADLSMPTIFSLASYINSDLLQILILLLLTGAAAKSAQLFLHNWLAQAMEGDHRVCNTRSMTTTIGRGDYRTPYRIYFICMVCLTLLYVLTLIVFIAYLVQPKFHHIIQVYHTSFNNVFELGTSASCLVSPYMIPFMMYKPRRGRRPLTGPMGQVYDIFIL